MSRTWARRDLHRHGHARTRGSCPTGKRRFATRDEADRALARITTQDAAGPKPTKPGRSYQCPQCDGWHLSSHPAPKWAS